jgi:hypothetical protein
MWGEEFMREYLEYGPCNIYNGRPIDVMPKLIADGRVPLSIEGLMRQRLSALDHKMPGADRDRMLDDQFITWWLSSYGSGDAVAYHPDGRMKIAYDASAIRQLTPETGLNCGSLVLTDEQYEMLPGPEFGREARFSPHDLTIEEVKEHPVWLALARGDKSLLEEYAEMTFGIEKTWIGNTWWQPWGGVDKFMGVYHNVYGTGIPRLQLWGITRLYGSNCESNAGGTRLNEDAKIVGVVEPGLDGYWIDKE